MKARLAPYNVPVTDSVELKHALRTRIRTERSAMGEDQRAEARAGLTALLSELVLKQGARSLSCFLPMPSEPDTRPFLEWAAQQGIDTLLPSSRPGGQLDWIRPSGAGTVRGAHGVDEPIGEILGPNAIESVDLMLIPAAAIDMRGNRLGWGRGYFDRALTLQGGRVPVFAVIHDHELLDSVPTETHDVPITGVVTPLRIITF